MRTIVNIPEADLRALDLLTHKARVSRAELVRRAVTDYLARHGADPDQAFGCWHLAEDGPAYQRRIREEW